MRLGWLGMFGLRSSACCILVLTGACTSALAQSLPSGLGWNALPNTAYSAQCPTPTPPGTTGCQAVTNAWSGGVYDSKRTRLVFTGGGHADYAGNEIYAVSLDTQTLSRIFGPTPNAQIPSGGCRTSYSDGNPAAHHTYNHLEYLPTQDKMVMIGGSQWQDGGFCDTGTWLFNFATNTWQALGTVANSPAMDISGWEHAFAYDPGNDVVYARDNFFLKMFNPATNAWTVRTNSDGSIGNRKQAIVDPIRKRYVFYQESDATLYWYDITSTTGTLVQQSGVTSGCTGFMTQDAAGFAYDAAQDRYIGWAGGNTVYVMHPTTLACTTVAYAGGPTLTTVGEFGRFRYAPKYNVFVTCNDWQANCAILRLTTTNFQARCLTTGVIVCQGFDSPDNFIGKNFTGESGLYGNESLAYKGTRDTTIAASGASSLRFEIDSGTGANSAGNWSQYIFGPSVGTQTDAFAPGETFYVQFRQRFSPEMLTASFGGGGWKQVIFHNDLGGTCGAEEITTNNFAYRNWPNMYTHCGQFAPAYDVAGTVALEFSQPYPPGSSGTPGTDYYCLENMVGNPANRCAVYATNAWMTFYYRVTIGAWGQPNSTIQAWVGYEGQPLKMWINRNSYTIYQNGAGDPGFNSVTLLPYDTGKNGQAHPTAYTWYDELIISSQPILAPDNSGADTTPPAAPTGVQVSQWSTP